MMKTILIVVFLAMAFVVFWPKDVVIAKRPRGVDEYRVKNMILTIYYGQEETKAVLDMDSTGVAFVTAWFEEPADTPIRRYNEGRRLNVGPAIIHCVKDTDEILDWTIIR